MKEPKHYTKEELQQLSYDIDHVNTVIRMICQWYNMEPKGEEDFWNTVEDIRCNHNKNHANVLTKLGELWAELSNQYNEFSTIKPEKKMPGPKFKRKRKPVSTEDNEIKRDLEMRLRDICDEYASTHECEYEVSPTPEGGFEIGFSLTPFRTFTLLLKDDDWDDIQGFHPVTLTFDDLTKIDTTAQLFERLEREDPLPMNAINFHCPPIVSLACSDDEDENIGTWNYIMQSWDLTEEGKRILEMEAEMKAD